MKLWSGDDLSEDVERKGFCDGHSVDAGCVLTERILPRPWKVQCFLWFPFAKCCAKELTQL